MYFSQVKKIETKYQNSNLTGNCISREFHVASLVNLAIGSIWRNGQLIMEPAGHSKFHNISPSHSKEVRLTDSFDILKHKVYEPLPSKFFKLGRNFLGLIGSRFHAVPTDKNELLIIPSVELLRFYTKSNSRIFRACIDGSLGQYVDFGRSKIDRDTVILFIEKKMLPSELKVLARMKWSLEAMFAYKKPHSFLSKTSANNINRKTKDKLVISSAFPFSEKTSMKVRGKKILLDCESTTSESAPKKNSTSMWTTFVTKIEYCSYDPGFRKIQVIDDYGEYESHSRGTSKEQTESNFVPVNLPHIEDSETIPIEDNNFADKRLTRLRQKFYIPKSDPIDDVEIDVTYRNDEGFETFQIIDTKEGEDGFTLGESNYTKMAERFRGVDLFSKVKKEDVRLKAFLDLLPILGVKLNTYCSAFSYQLETLGYNNSLHGRQIARLPSKMKGCISWHLAQDERARDLVIVRISNKKRCYYLLELESNKSNNKISTMLFYQKDFKEVTVNTLNEVLRLTALNKNWIKASSKNIRSLADKDRVRTLFSSHKVRFVNHPQDFEILLQSKKTKQIEALLGAWANKLIELFRENHLLWLSKDPPTY